MTTCDHCGRRGLFGFHQVPYLGRGARLGTVTVCRNMARCQRRLRRNTNPTEV